ncbi:MAG TPA: serine hydroxymethyltransferase, partial [Magnetococcales bacterium]|nr:serine hydroxymethyltransferase [Magnetococcales bacterium]
TGKDAEAALERAGMTCNKNAIPNDPRSPFVTSGVRLGTPAATSRGFDAEDFREVGRWIVRVLDAVSANPQEAQGVEMEVRRQTLALCRRYPIYPNL